MTIPTTEQVYAALFALVPSITWSTHPSGFVTSSRRVKLFSDVSSDQQPALFQAEHDEIWEQKTGLPYRRVLQADWIVYQSSGLNTSLVPATENNLIIDAVKSSVTPTPLDIGYPSKRFTLGGLVYHCWIDGRVFKDPGDIDNQGMLVFPFKLMLPG